ncbi:MAG: apolipoprotein N-acyltransferase [Actinomycetota bacterium]|nr:apolipoprotein N-acyltransferase [Actinomycetota bacterium]
MSPEPGSPDAAPVTSSTKSRPGGSRRTGARRREARLGRLVRPAAALLSGGLLAASLPPTGLWPLAVIGFAGAWVVTDGQALGSRAALGLLTGAGQFGPALFWVTSFSAPGYPILVMLESCFVAVAFAAVPPRRFRLAAFPAAVTLAEWLRDSWPFGGFPLGGAALGQAQGPLLPASRLVGGLGMLALAALAGAAAGSIFTRAVLAVLAAGSARNGAGSRARGRRVGLSSTAVAAAVLLAMAAAGHFAPRGGRPTGTRLVAAVQGGGPRGLRAYETNPVAPFRRQMAESGLLSRGPALVVWPEDTVALTGRLRGSTAQARLSQLARRTDATLVAGVTDLVGAHHFLNRAVAWSPSGQIVGSYEKVHRVPFGEYVPWRPLISKLVNLRAVPRDAIAGHHPGILSTPAGHLGVLISYEVFFSARSRASISAGASVLLVPTNTSSYLSGQVPAQELAASRIRAVEEGRALVQVSPTGFSAFVLRSGRVEARTSLGAPGVLERTVHLYHGSTVFQDLGQRPVLAVSCLALGAAWVPVRTRRRHGRSGLPAGDPSLH